MRLRIRCGKQSLLFKKKIAKKKVIQVASKYQKHSKKPKVSKQAMKEASKQAKLDKVLFKRTLGKLEENNCFFYMISWIPARLWT